MKAENINIPQITENSRISLLTSYPYDGEVYAVYGHTALRINNTLTGQDIVFNYGIFNFKQPNFMFRFAKGETDYGVLAIPFSYYILEYQSRGEPVVEQVLNLTDEEKKKILSALLLNTADKDWTYRYNFFYDNCATRIRDIVENAIDGKIEYTPSNREQTFRDLLHEFNVVLPWSGFGIDLVIGADADKVVADREKMFLPIYMMQAYTNAKIINGSQVRKLVSSENVIVNEDVFAAPHSKHVKNYPFIIGCVLLLITLNIAFFAVKKQNVMLIKIYSFILFLLAGIGGCIIFFLMFFSEHPATNPNWNIIWLNPLQLIFAFLFLFKYRSKIVYYYHFINFAALSLFLLAWFLIPQYLDITFVLYILSILACSVANILIIRKLNK